MKVKMRISVLPLFVLLLSEQFNCLVSENDVKKYVDSNPFSTSNYLEENFIKFVAEYNKVSSEKWDATYIEKKIKVIDTIEELEYVFLDFDNLNGYALVGFNYSFLEFSINGQLDYLDGLTTCYWNKYDGFVYEHEGKFLSYENRFLSEDEFNSISCNYSGQESDARKFEGITDISSYLSDRYGGSWDLDSSKK